MKLIVEEQEYEIDLTRLSTREAINLQKTTGYTPKRMLESLADMDAIALTAVVWLAYKRAGHNVKFDDVDVDIMSIQFIDDEDEDEDEDPKGQ